MRKWLKSFGEVFAKIRDRDFWEGDLGSFCWRELRIVGSVGHAVGGWGAVFSVRGWYGGIRPGRAQPVQSSRFQGHRRVEFGDKGV